MNQDASSAERFGSHVGASNSTIRTKHHDCSGPTEVEPAQLTMDRRAPFEIWQHICSYLYPSQLSRMSMVSTTLHNVVESLPYWSLLFRRIFGATKALWLLPRVPESKSYMLYMCASSSMVCESCYKYFNNYLEVDNVASLPLPVQVESWRRQHNGIQMVGCPVDLNWTIQMCLPCRQTHYSLFEERIPYSSQRSYIYREVSAKKYMFPIATYDAVAQAITSRTGSTGYKEYLESEVIQRARVKYGGDVGIRATAFGSLEERFEKSDERIMGYSFR